MKTRIVGQIYLAERAEPRDGDRIAEALCRAGDSIEGLLQSHAGVHLDSSMGGGDLTWDLLLENEGAVDAFCQRVRAASGGGSFTSLSGMKGALASQVAHVELAIPETISGEIGMPGLVGVKRTLWLKVLPGTEQALIDRFEAETPLLARAVPAIRNWQWSRVRTRSPNPMTLEWTHLWEQEFETRAGLEEDYMASPMHWGYIDRWFDPEMPEQIVDIGLAHLACPATASILG